MAFLGVGMVSSIDVRFIVEDLTVVGRQLIRDWKGGREPDAIHRARSVLAAIEAVLGPFTGGANIDEAEYQFRSRTVWALDSEIREALRG